ncbi:peptide ABC transporter permease [Pilimelia anulata]|uniref:Peptide ABC transporter permease n=1 Tax=Pilimelia anulata TaxID=53371 RepID=A0A8J3B8B5_9ACTN|nr:ABC transporter permease [Pilimelia anulata]GGK00730.1 peptide ABC transporter permease [Pilimelia anulata]
MNLREVIRFALRGVAANKLRSALTVLGVLIGVASVILLVAVGTGSARAVSDRIAALGASTVTVQPTGRGGTGGLTVPVAEALRDPLLAPDVKSVSPVASTSGTLAFEGVDHEVNQFIGTRASYFAAANIPIARGAAFTDADEAAGRRVVLIGDTVATELFGRVDPLGKQLTANGTLFTVGGVLGPRGTAGFGDPNDVVIAPLSAVRQTLTGYGQLSSILVEATSAARVNDVQTQVATILDQRLRVAATTGTGQNARTPYRILNATQLLQTQTETAQTFTVLLGAVAGISLLVGGIGITNIMLVTVTERTREIGIRKALGAPRWVILAQFLVEATLLSVVGGALGVGVALLGARFPIVGVVPVVVPASIALALGVSIAIGLIFGGLPASRAAGLRPIDALRYE